MKRITLDRGTTVRTFSPPPAKFDPLRAGAADLLKHGFPARPTDPGHVERYNQLFRQMRNRFQYLEPELKINERRRHGPIKPAAGRPPSVGTGNEFHPLWSGGVVRPPAGQSFRWIVGEWTIPNVGAAPDGQTYYCTSWIGIDGDISVASTDLCQAGINLDVTWTGGSPARHVSAFFEWFPGPEIGIQNFPVNFGDTVVITVCTLGAGSTEALVFFANLTSGHGTSAILDAPTQSGQQVSLVGDSAQWVVERPAIGAQAIPALLADYAEVFFSGCQAVSYSSDGSRSDVVNGGSQTRIDMVEDTTVLSHGILVADTVIQCVYLAPGTGKV
jgi:Peptidase A4 family